MKITVQREALLEAIKPYKALQSTTNIGPAANLLLITAGGRRINFFGLTMNVCLETAIEIDTDGEYQATIAFKSLFEVVNSFKKETILQISLNSKNLVFKSSKARTQIPVQSPEIFPDIKGPSGAEPDVILNSKEFYESLSTVDKFASNDGVRSYINSVLIEPSGQEGYIRLVTTDGISLATRLMPGFLEKSHVLNIKAIETLKTILALNYEEDCEVFDSEAVLYFNLGLFKVAITKIQKEFPDYARIIPKGQKLSLILDSEEVIEALQIAKTTSDENRRNFTLSISPERVLILTHSPKGDSEAALNLSQVSDPFEMNVVFDLERFHKLIKALKSKQVELKLVNKLNPVIFNSENKKTLGLLMPMKEY